MKGLRMQKTILALLLLTAMITIGMLAGCKSHNLEGTTWYWVEGREDALQYTTFVNNTLVTGSDGFSGTYTVEDDHVVITGHGGAVFVFTIAEEENGRILTAHNPDLLSMDPPILFDSEEAAQNALDKRIAAVFQNQKDLLQGEWVQQVLTMEQVEEHERQEITIRENVFTYVNPPLSAAPGSNFESEFYIKEGDRRGTFYIVFEEPVSFRRCNRSGAKTEPQAYARIEMLTERTFAISRNAFVRP